MTAFAETDQPLETISREHQHALELCGRIREGLDRNIETSRIREYIDWFERNYLEPHFRFEEEVVFPLLGNNVRVKKGLANHRRIKRLLSCSCTDQKVLNLLEEELATYIRFEERILYKELNAVISPEKLAEIEARHTRLDSSTGSWKDKFWLS